MKQGIMNGIGIEELRLINRFLRILAVELQRQGKRSEEIERVLEMERERIYQDIELQESLNNEINVRMVLRNHSKQFGRLFPEIATRGSRINLQQLRVHSENFVSRLVSKYSKYSKSKRAVNVVESLGGWLVILGAFLSWTVSLSMDSFPYIIYVFAFGFFWTWNSLGKNWANHNLWLQHIAWSILWLITVLTAIEARDDYDVNYADYNGLKIFAILASVLALALAVAHLGGAILAFTATQNKGIGEKLLMTEALLKTAMLAPPAILIVWMSVAFDRTVYPLLTFTLTFLFFWLLYRIVPSVFHDQRERSETTDSPRGNLWDMRRTFSLSDPSGDRGFSSGYSIEARKLDFEQEFGIPYSQASFVKITMNRKRIKEYFKSSRFSLLLIIVALSSLGMVLLIAMGLISKEAFAPYSSVYSWLSYFPGPIFLLVGILAVILELIIYIRRHQRDKIVKKVLSQFLIYDGKIIPSTAITSIYGLTPSSTINALRMFILEEVITLEFYPEEFAEEKNGKGGS